MVTVNDINTYIETAQDCKLSKASWKTYKSNLNTLDTQVFKYKPDVDMSVFLLHPDELCQQLYANNIPYQKATDVLKALKFCFDYATIITNSIKADPELSNKWTMYKDNFLVPVYGKIQDKPKKKQTSKPADVVPIENNNSNKTNDVIDDEAETKVNDDASVTSIETEDDHQNNINPVIKNDPNKAQQKSVYNYIKDLERKVYALNERTIFLQDVVIELMKALPNGVPSELSTKLFKMASQQFGI